MTPRRLVSGGQTGADRAALDAALRLGLPYGGWCPRGGWAEDLPDPPGLLASYPQLQPTPTRDPAERTARNVRDSDATLVISPPGARSAGTELTLRTARTLDRPVLVSPPDGAAEVAAWLVTLGDGVLNVAGPRESEVPGLYARTLRLLLEVLRPDT